MLLLFFADLENTQPGLASTARLRAQAAPPCFFRLVLLATQGRRGQKAIPVRQKVLEKATDTQKAEVFLF